MKKRTTSEYIELCRKVHGDIYDYSLVDYRSKDEKITVICKVHGEFKQTANSHLRGFGCRFCGYIVSGDLKRNSADKFIEKSRQRFGDQFDYSLVKYENAHKEITLRCEIHNYVFNVSPSNHLKKLGRGGCQKCRVESSTSAKLKGKGYFIEKMSDKFPHINFSDCNFIKASNKIFPVCDLHGVYETTPKSVLSKNSKHGCPQCSVFNPSPSEPCDFYILSVGDDFLKFGITTRFQYRISRIKANTELEVKPLFLFSLYSFKDAECIEKSIKKSFKAGQKISRDLFRDGHTETLPISYYNYLISAVCEQLS
jgi:hypothetical protein